MVFETVGHQLDISDSSYNRHSPRRPTESWTPALTKKSRANVRRSACTSVCSDAMMVPIKCTLIVCRLARASDAVATRAMPTGEIYEDRGAHRIMHELSCIGQYSSFIGYSVASPQAGSPHTRRYSRGFSEAKVDNEKPYSRQSGDRAGNELHICVHYVRTKCGTCLPWYAGVGQRSTLYVMMTVTSRTASLWSTYFSDMPLILPFHPQKNLFVCVSSGFFGMPAAVLIIEDLW